MNPILPSVSPNCRVPPHLPCWSTNIRSDLNDDEFDIDCDSLSIYYTTIYVYSNIKYSVSRQTYCMVLPYCDSRSAIGGYRHPLTRRGSKADCPVKSRSFQFAGSCIFLPQKLRRSVAIKTEMISVTLVP